MSCGCLEHHWQELAAFVLVGLGIAIPIYFIFKRLVKIQTDKIRRDKLMTKQLSEFYGYNSNPDGIE